MTHQPLHNYDSDQLQTTHDKTQRLYINTENVMARTNGRTKGQTLTSGPDRNPKTSVLESVYFPGDSVLKPGAGTEQLRVGVRGVVRVVMETESGEEGGMWGGTQELMGGAGGGDRCTGVGDYLKGELLSRLLKQM
jgi:hypothetical protein